MKQYILFGQKWPFLLISLHKTAICLHIILCWSFLKIIPENCPTRISKNCFWRRFCLVHCFDCSFVWGVKQWVHFSSIIMNRCKNSTLLLLSIAKHLIETSSGCYFCFIMDKCDNHHVHSFLRIYPLSRNTHHVWTFSRWSLNHFVDFLHNFWRGHLIWTTNAIFVLEAHKTLFKLCHPLLYCCKRRSKLPRIESSWALLVELRLFK